MTMLLKRLGAESTANSYTAGYQFFQKTAALSSGDYVVVWMSDQGRGDYDIVAQRFSADGVRIGGETVVNIPASFYSPQSYPNVSALASGGFVAAWIDSYNVIKARMVDADGVPVGQEIPITSTAWFYHPQPAIAALPGGGFVIGWTDERKLFSSDGFDLRGQMFDSSGARVGPEFTINTLAQGSQTEVKAAALTGGGFVFVWTHQTGDSADPGNVKAQMFDSAGNRIGTEILVPTAQGFFEAGADIAALPNGGFVVSWQGIDPVLNKHVAQAQMFSATGDRIGPLVTASDPENGVASVQVTSLAGGGFVVGWASHRGQMFDAEGNRLGSQFQINSDRLDGSYLDMTTLSSGRVVAVWDADRPNAGYDVRMQVFRAPLIGTPLADSIDGSAVDDGIAGLGADDILDGKEGDDSLEGGAGDDVLIGGEGDDAYAGGDGTDTLDFSGEPGPVAVNLHASLFIYPAGHPFASRSISPGEALDSFGNYETVSGIENLVLTGGDDRALGSEGANRIEGLAGNDLLLGAGGNDIILGGEGDDTIDGAGGDDAMIGGIGNDIYLIDSSADSVVENAGEGVDEVRTTLAGYSLLGTNLENLRAFSNVAHDFRGNGSNNAVTGGTGSDVIRLEDGGDDSAVGGGGNDQIFYGAAFTAADSNNGGSGTDVVILQGNYAVTMGTGSLTNVEYLSLQSGSSTRYQNLPVTDHNYNITFVDSNVAAGQRFTVNASQLLAAESFTFNGAAESDGSFLVYGGFGADVLTGGAGHDVFHFEGSRWGSGDSVNGGAGADSVVIRAGAGTHHIQFGETQLIGVESISVSDRFGLGGSSLPSYEMVLANGNVAAGATLIVNASTLLDPSQTLSVDGSAVSGGHLRLYGGAGGDTLIGGDGDDLFFAAGGADRMTGGEGRDTFQLRSLSDSSATGSDVILDFESGVDRIDLAYIDADSNSAGNQAFAFVGAAFSGNGTAGSGVAGELRCYQDSESAVWYVEGDVDGDGKADFQLVVVTATPEPLAGSDFIA